MAFSSIGSIHSMVNTRKVAPVSTGFSGSVQRLFLAGTDSKIIADNWFSVNGHNRFMVATSYGLSPKGRNYLSTDGGVTWTKMFTPVGDGGNFRQACISKNGVYRVYSINATASTQGAWSSSNSGANYTRTNASYTGAFVSDDGRVKLVSAAGIFRIFDSPNTNTFSTSVSSVASSLIYGSADGQYILTTHFNLGLQLSTNFGASFTAITNRLPTGATNGIINSAVSGTGQYMLTSGTGYKLWRSTDFGASFTNITGTGGLPNPATYTFISWGNCVMSRSGQYMAVAGAFRNAGTPLGTNAYLFISSDFGVNWTPKIINGFSTAQADGAIQYGGMSSNDNDVPIRIFVVTFNEGIYYIDF
jgi:hypothetical protein